MVDETLRLEAEERKRRREKSHREWWAGTYPVLAS
jgi:hypothetical protein